MTPHTLTKLHRWIDLLGFLVRRRAPVTFGELRQGVASYARASTVAAHRSFERDKRELRTLALPLETTVMGFSSEVGYRLRRATIGLPILRRAREGEARSALPASDRAAAIPPMHVELLERLAAAVSSTPSAGTRDVVARARRALRALNRDLDFTSPATLAPVGPPPEDATQHLLLLFDVLPLLPLDGPITVRVVHEVAGAMGPVVLDILQVSSTRPEPEPPAEAGIAVASDGESLTLHAPVFARPLRPTMSDLVALRMVAESASSDASFHALADLLVDHLSPLARRAVPIAFSGDPHPTVPLRRPGDPGESSPVERPADE